MATFNLADLFEIVNDHVGGREAIVAGDRRLTYDDLEARANRLAHHLLDAGVKPGEFVGLQLTNGPEYVEGMLAAFKIRAVPVNVNYRYVTDELRYLFTDAGLVALVVHRRFTSGLPEVETLRHVLVVGDGSGGGAGDGFSGGDYEDALAAASPERDFGPRSADDLYVAYTGGTTGMPKGVLWRHEDIFFAGMGGGDPYHTGDTVSAPAQLVDKIPDPGLCALATPPFMHVSAHWLVFSVLYGGGKIVVVPEGRFDPPTVWHLVERERVQMLVLVGDAMARPLADALREADPKPDTSSLLVIGSGGAILSPSTKEDLTGLLPHIMVVDGFGSSETGMVGSQTSSQGGGPASGPRFSVNEQTTVLDDDLKPVESGSGVTGRLARRGHIPLGYHRDPDKTKATFVEVDGVRWVLPGDHATVDTDGTIVLLGRGSVSINTGGEKVYPEEVESALKSHPSVDDAVVVGVPDERWGERVVAIVRAKRDLTLEDLQATCRERLAGYKVPRELVLVDEVVRSPAGKPDYRWARERALAETP